MATATSRTVKRWILVPSFLGALLGVGPGMTAILPPSGKIGFEGDGSGVWNLSVMKPNGTGLADLDSPEGSADLAWSPDGKRIAFEADALGDGNLEVFVMNLDGTGLTPLTDAAEWDLWPAWFPSGQQLAFTSFRTGIPQIWVMNADGSDQHALTEGDEFACLQPNVSPSGQQIVYQRESMIEPPKVWIMNADGSDQHALTPAGPTQDVDAQWSPDGQRIVFSSNRFGSFEVFTMDADGLDVEQLTSMPGADANPTFSPDGQWIAWGRQTGATGDVWIMRADGTGQLNVTNTPAVVELFPDWHQGRLKP
jgi:TolB protein